MGALMLAGLVGCGRDATPPPIDTGARDTARAYYEGVIRRDWPALYASLHPSSRKRYTSAQFVHLAGSNRKKIGFEPEVVHVRSCEEHGEEALARVVLTSRTARHKQRYNESLVVRRSGGTWHVVLPDNFGR